MRIEIVSALLEFASLADRSYGRSISDIAPGSDGWKEEMHAEWKRVVKVVGEQVRVKGHLFILPTETVYGLGANALNEESVMRIYQAKGRPLNDPCICHVANNEEAFSLYECGPEEMFVVRALARAFWPGPLTIVARASAVVPALVTAMTGFVSVRRPEHAVALALIEAAGVPIAAPSANRFGHISPSTAAHAMKNFANLQSFKGCNQDSLFIFDGGASRIGIESTVVKVELKKSDESAASPSKRLFVTVLRRGAKSVGDIQGAIRQRLADHERVPSEKNDDTGVDLEVVAGAHISVSDRIQCYQLTTHAATTVSCAPPREGALPREDAAEKVATLVEACRILSYGATTANTARQLQADEPMCSPGTLLSHYAPIVPTFLCTTALESSNGYHRQAGGSAATTTEVLLPARKPADPVPTTTSSSSPCTTTASANHNNSISTSAELSTSAVPLDRCVLIDAFDKLRPWRERAASYLPLLRVEPNKSNDYGESPMIYLTRAFRKARFDLFSALHQAEEEALAGGAAAILIADFSTEAAAAGEDGLAVFDRIYRSASGRLVHLRDGMGT